MHRIPVGFVGILIFLAVLTSARQAGAADRLCDTAYEDCRTPLIELIRAETVGIDVAFWFMEDTRYATELIRRWQAGVPVRVLMDTRAVTQYGYHTAQASLDMLRDAGIPMRRKSSGGILHWKMMLFAGQGAVEFSAANFSPEAFVPIDPYVNYVDEIIYFTDEGAIVDSFRTRFDDVWTNTSGYADYANVTERQRHYPTFSTDPRLNFVPWQNFRSRSIARYKAETQRVDAIMYRITDRTHTDQMIAAVSRGVTVRLITEPQEYRSVSRLWHSWNVDRMYMAGVQVRMRQHAGLTHEKLTLLQGQQMAIFGSSNWTSASAESQLEHNLFTTDPAFFAWTRDHFARKWNNAGPSPETRAFVPLPPDTPVLKSPAHGSAGIGASATLTWYAGPWAHKYDVYLGTDPSNMVKVLDDRELGPSEYSSDYVTWPVSGLAEGTTYYWKVVSRTMANQARTSTTWSFSTGGTGGSPVGGPLPTPWSNRDIGNVGAAGSASFDDGTFTIRGAGADIWNAADEFHFVYRTLAGNGTVQARVASVSNTDVWTKVGVMIRESLTSGSKHAAMFVSAGKGLAFQRRTSTGGASAHTSGGSATAPRWVRLTRSGGTITAFASSNGSTWTTVGAATVAMGTTVFVGLAVTSHNDGVLATGRIDSVSVTAGDTEPAPSTLPSGWLSRDIGGVGSPGHAAHASGTFTIDGSGADIWSGSDEFHFAYTTMSGDGAIVARVRTVENVDVWTKAGVMMREALTPEARHASVFVTPAKGIAFQRRTTTGGVSAHTSGGGGTAPRWVRLVRSGNVFSAYTSADGAGWTLIGTDTIPMTSSILVGLPVTSHSDGAVATATVDAVTVTR